MRYLEQERKRWESTVGLLTHQLRTALTPITTQIGRARAMARKLSGDDTAQRLVELLGRTEDLSMRLAESSRQTVAGHVLQVDRSDMEFERYPLSVLVTNVAEGFAQEAEKRRRQLQIEKSVELLPAADLDVARFTIVLSNFLDNAIKYSYPNTVIKVRGASDPLQDPRSAERGHRGGRSGRRDPRGRPPAHLRTGGTRPHRRQDGAYPRLRAGPVGGTRCDRGARWRDRHYVRADSGANAVRVWPTTSCFPFASLCTRTKARGGADEKDEAA